MRLEIFMAQGGKRLGGFAVVAGKVVVSSGSPDNFSTWLWAAGSHALE